MGDVVKSVYNTDEEILKAISLLHLSGFGFEVDPCYSRGVMWKNTGLEPLVKFDITPTEPGCVAADCTAMPIQSASVRSIAFDPPFMFGQHGQTKNAKMTKRFTMFDDWGGLERMYRESLKEFKRVLVSRGIVAFKCQDYTDSRTTMTHCYVHNWAQEAGFYVKDLFIKVTLSGRIYNPTLTQRHARKFHAYWFVLQA